MVFIWKLSLDSLNLVFPYSLDSVNTCTEIKMAGGEGMGGGGWGVEGAAGKVATHTPQTNPQKFRLEAKSTLYQNGPRLV